MTVAHTSPQQLYMSDDDAGLTERRGAATPPWGLTCDSALKLRRIRLALAVCRSRSLSVLADGEGGTANSTRRAGPRSGVDLHHHVGDDWPADPCSSLPSLELLGSCPFGVEDARLW